EIVERGGRNHSALGRKRRDGIVVARRADDVDRCGAKPPHHVAAHAAEPDHAESQRKTSFMLRLRGKSRAMSAERAAARGSAKTPGLREPWTSAARSTARASRRGSRPR